MTKSNHAIRILIVDDHPLFRDGLKYRLSLRSAWTVCGETGTSPEAMRLVQELKPDLVIIELSLKQGNGLELVKQMAASDARLRILVCSSQDEHVYARRAIQAGAQGFLNKSEASEKLIKAVDRILEGNMFLTDNVMTSVLKRALKPDQQSPVDQLTDRELAVFEAIGRGLQVRQIAATLFLSVKTVETYRDRAKKKLGLRTSMELIHYAVRWMTEHKPE